MLKVKSIKKEGKFLKIIIKVPWNKTYKEVLLENNLIFGKSIDFLEPGITIDGDIELIFILRNWEDIKPYIENKE